MRMKKECFTVLLIVVLILQDPVVVRAKRMENNMKLWKEQNAVYSLTDKAVQNNSVDSLSEYQIQYYLNGGTNSLTNPLTIQRENLPVVLAAPKREGYNFAGWYADSGYKQKVERINEENAGNCILYAKWTKAINVHHNVQMYSYTNKADIHGNSKVLKDCSYDFLENIQIPGMPSTREADVAENKITDASVCPQGICLTDDYFLISAYTTNSKRKLGCLHVFDRDTGEYLVTLGMKKKSHLGGLTFDGESIWVCHSDNKTLECIPYSFVKRISSKKPQTVVDCTAWFDSFKVSNSPSCIAYYDGKIWVATHTKLFNSVMISYRPTEDGLEQLDSYVIPEKVQGVAFDDDGRIYLSTSYGRRKSSYLKMYDSLESLNKKPNRPAAKVEMPPCSEEIALEEGMLYVLFESASEKYFEGTDGKGTSVSPIDRILTLSKTSIF